ncbi:O-antigen polymerase [Alkalibacillus haloalkaliphilus]|uniref:Uncharacterized protein n=1 Tax=Alkalibacillus haloalkaliphilus TaxID=94136 RepID=A0A511W6E4_9BACI|nr:O-antigen polymerase [Alkalibacillus haloalkaliphilus]GEN46664.1 hypothetical protein AHA02nite_24400 [Alkalibacillus haloalkaliphilus]
MWSNIANSHLLNKSFSKDNIKTLPIKLLIALLSTIVSFIVFLYSFEHYSDRFLFLLPLSYAFLIILFPAMWKYSKNNIGMIILNAVIFIRYVISPLFRSLTINEPAIRGILPSSQGIHYGILILIIELFVAFFVIQMFAHKFYKDKTIKKFKPIESKLVLIIFLFIGFSIFSLFPQLLGRYNFFLASGPFSDINLDIPFAGLLIIITDLILIIIAIIIINHFKIKYDKSPKFRYVIFSLLAILPVITIFKGTSRFSVVIPTIAFLVILIKLYPMYKKRIILSIALLAIIVFIVFTFSLDEQRSGETNYSLNHLAHTLDAYMSGPNNMGRVVDLQNNYGVFLTTETLKNDTFNNIALLSSLSDSSNTTTAWFNYMFYNHRLYTDQIVPLSGQSYIHFGVIGTPLLLAITLILMMFFDSKIRYENRIEFTYLYVTAVCNTSMAMMVSFGSIYPFFINIFIPIMLIFYMNRKIRL